jgi:hypothetical protein
VLIPVGTKKIAVNSSLNDSSDVEAVIVLMVTEIDEEEEELNETRIGMKLNPPPQIIMSFAGRSVVIIKLDDDADENMNHVDAEILADVQEAEAETLKKTFGFTDREARSVKGGETTNEEAEVPEKSVSS